MTLRFITQSDRALLRHTFRRAHMRLQRLMEDPESQNPSPYWDELMTKQMKVTDELREKLGLKP